MDPPIATINSLFRVKKMVQDKSISNRLGFNQDGLHFELTNIFTDVHNKDASLCRFNPIVMSPHFESSVKWLVIREC